MPKSRSANVICFGEALWDVLPSMRSVGGAPLNVAYHLKKLGVRAWPMIRRGMSGGGPRAAIPAGGRAAAGDPPLLLFPLLLPWLVPSYCGITPFCFASKRAVAAFGSSQPSHTTRSTKDETGGHAARSLSTPPLDDAGSLGGPDGLDELLLFVLCSGADAAAGGGVGAVEGGWPESSVSFSLTRKSNDCNIGS